MSSNGRGSGRGTSRSFTSTIDLLEDLVGADVPRNLLRVAVVAQDLDALTTELVDPNGNVVDPAKNELAAALVSDGSDELQVDLTSGSVGNLDVDLAASSLGNLGVDLQAANAGTLPVEQQTPVEVEAEDPNGTVGGVRRRSNALQSSIENSEIAVPVDLQASLDVNSQNYGVAIDTQVQVEISLDGYATGEVLFANASSSTDLTVEKSWDQTNYYQVDTASAVTSYNSTYTDLTAKYLRLTVTGTGTGGDTADVVLGGAL